MFVWAPIPEPYRELGSLEFAVKLTREAHVSVSPGVGFGPGGEGFVRFALVENEQRIAQAVRGIRRALPALAAAPSRVARRGVVRLPPRPRRFPWRPLCAIRHPSGCCASRLAGLASRSERRRRSQVDALDLETLTGLQAEKLMEDGELTSVAARPAPTSSASRR